ncbi:MAG: hypothetical protein H7Y00_12010 [Fimbriimonadaceae bacterium]|nr:hypothetical protein [Chitinophagales bacterium]
MKKHKAWAIVMVGLIVVLPLISLYVMMQGAKLRQNAKPSSIYSASSILLPQYILISQRGDTIRADSMNRKVCVYEFYSDDCYEKRYSGTHPFFELQEDYYGKTFSLRFISVSLTDSVTGGINLQHYSNRYAAREVWHVVGGDTTYTQNIFAACKKYAAEKNIVLGNYNCPVYVFLADSKGRICGIYDINNKEQFSFLYNDILFLIAKKNETQ